MTEFIRDEDPALGRLAVKVLRELLGHFRPPRCSVALVLFTYAPGSSAFASTYPEKRKLVEVLTARLRRWESKPAPMLYDPERDGWLPDAQGTDAWGRFLDELLRKETGGKVGFACFVGEGERTQYFASGDREGCANLFRELLPMLRAEMN